MKCVDPFVKAGEVYSCGRCLPCKFRARRIWFHRVLLEASQHDYSSVVTLTYDESALPASGELQSAHFRDWLKRYRKRAMERYPWRRLRFFACGEYGEKSGRPHYHVVLFGQPGCLEGRSQKSWCADCGCDTCQDLTQTWPIGAISVGKLNRESAAYVAGYVTRKVLLSTMGRTVLPFIRMSLKPGIGAGAMYDVASAVLKYDLDLPSVLGVGRQRMLLGRYLRNKLSEYSNEEVPQWQVSEAMQAVRDYAWARSLSIHSVYAELNGIYASQLAQKEASKTTTL